MLSEILTLPTEKVTNANDAPENPIPTRRTDTSASHNRADLRRRLSTTGPADDAK
jgi:hypothetical protein